MIDLDRLCRAEWGRLLSSLIRAFGDFDLAEECLQEAFAAAVTEWSAAPPHNPRAWLYGTARHRAIDRIRQRNRSRTLLAELAPFDERHLQSPKDAEVVPDERLRLLFTCCHPALSTEAQVALTLRTLGGLTTEEIAHAFLLPAATMAQRLVRAKAKIREARIPYAEPEASDLPERLPMVMSVLYLIFNEGYTAARGDHLLRHALSSEAIELTRVLGALLGARWGQVPAEVDSLLALMLLHEARRNARVSADGRLVLLEDQDRALWNRAQIAEGCALVEAALRRAPPGTFALEAAIAAVHAEARTAGETDWAQISALYSRLFALHPSPVIALNRAVAVAMAEGPSTALPLIDALEPTLAHYHLWHAARADLLRRLGRHVEALHSYRQALELTQNGSEIEFLGRRMAELEQLNTRDPVRSRGPAERTRE